MTRLGMQKAAPKIEVRQAQSLLNIVDQSKPSENSTPSKSMVFWRQVALLTTIASGFSGLVYEVTWHKQLTAIVGSEARATAIILAVFLGGLAIGYEVFGRISRKISTKNNIRLLAYGEIAIGIWALFFNDFFELAFAHAKNLPLTGPQALFWEILIACGLMLVPTACMGGTLPLLTQGLSFNLKDAPSFHAKIYAFNTIGAFFGCIAAGFYLIPTHGLNLTLFFMSIVNLIVGCSLLLVSIKTPTFDEQKPSKNQTKQQGEPIDRSETAARFRYFAIACLSGFYAICLQTVLIRATGLTAGSSEYAFSMIVALYIGMLALGASSISKRENLPSNSLINNQITLFAGALLTYLSIPYWSYTNHLIRIMYSNSKISFYAYFLSLFIAIGAITYLMLSRMGRTLPLLFGVSVLKRNKLGTYVGTLYATNTIGCVVGALIGGYILLNYLNLDEIFRVSLAAIAASVIIASFQQKPTIRIVSIFAFVTFIFGLPEWDKQQLGRGLFRESDETTDSYEGKEKFFSTMFPNTKLITYKDSPNGTVAIYKTTRSKETSDHKTTDPSSSSAPNDSNEHAPLESLALFVNGKSDGSTLGDYPTTIMLAHLPGLLHKSQTGTVAVVGFGTGITIGGLTMYPEITSIDCIEISSALRELSDTFSPYNWGASSHPKVQWIEADAYRHLLTTNKKYDLIISEPSNPWVTGVEKLFSQEYYEVVRNKLTEDGIYAQWAHTYSMSSSTLGMIINTYRSVFPNIYSFVVRSDIIFIGSKKPLDVQNLQLMRERLAKNKAVAQSLKEIEINSADAILSYERWNPPDFYRNFSIHSLDFPQLAFAAGKNFYENASFNLSDFLSRKPIQPWIQEFAPKSLSFTFDAQFRPTSTEALRSYVAAICGSHDFSSLELGSYADFDQPCRSILFREIRNGSIEYPKTLPHTVSNIMLTPYRKEDWTPKLAKIFLAGYQRLNSPISPIPREELDLKTNICYAKGEEDLGCIFEHAVALMGTGQITEAETKFNQYKDQFTAKFGPQSAVFWQNLAAETSRLAALKESHRYQ